MKNIIQKLKDNNFQVYLAKDCTEALKLAFSLVPEKSTIAMGNSMTLRETGIFDELASGKYHFINQFEKGISREENLRRRREALLADVYFTSSNAVTETGALVNIDGKGNRVAAMMFGPEKVIVVVGKNKIVKDEEAAWQKLRNAAAPNLAARLGRDTPCAKNGVCSDCKSSQRICRFYTVIRSQMPDDANRIHVIIVDQVLGI